MENTTMARAQAGLCAEGNLHSVYLMFNAFEGVESRLRPCLASVARFIEELSDQYCEPAFNGFVAIGANYWDSLYSGARPLGLKSFPNMKAEGREAPAYEYDVFVHIRSDRYDINHLVANQIVTMMDGLMELVDEERGFRFLENRDLTGFVDGTENPQGSNRAKVAIVGSEDRQFQGGSYIHTQKFIHNLSSWNQLPVKQQEDIIGRTKQDNVEYASADKPLTSHIKRVNLKDEDGQSMEILRQSMPFGGVKSQGLFFISLCANSRNFEAMLESMMKGDGHGHYDHLMNFTQAVTGSSFFAPSMEFLEEFADD
ncbi:peroxidase [Paraferrimonas haliotis]|uniref:Peroxidase n=2 Tax=Paraferrimonas haliotis TaxID=2013866 RepID=A0AA37WWG4_9GAMM|nr:Dyp-type peroxidase [Paraferrimonas haliotis]GLS82369.1 peroxidase [Paraferrimonas haliotis]